MTPVTHAWAETNGVATRYALSEGDGPVLVLVHEMGGMLETYDAMARILERRWRILRYDLRGAGLSEKARGTLDIADLSADLDALLDCLKIGGTVVVGGTAVGAAVAIHFAATRPERTRALVAMAPATGTLPGRRQALLERADRLEAVGVRPSVDQGLERAYPAALRTDVRVFDRLRLQRLAADPFGVAAATRMLAGLDLTPEMSRISCPALVVAGSLDGIRPPETVAAAASAIPGAVLRIIESGHFMAVQTPDLVAREIEAFLTGSP